MNSLDFSGKACMPECIV